mgnify:FL=1
MLLHRAQAAEGDVMKIDKARGRLTLKHGGVRNLDMPPMTMAFRTKEPRLLDPLAVGDKVSFQAEKVEGQYTVTSLQKR